MKSGIMLKLILTHLILNQRIKVLTTVIPILLKSKPGCKEVQFYSKFWS